ncbi:MAG: hypothetical protein RR885_06155 [Oscillospiraceae bacterium]
MKRNVHNPVEDVCNSRKIVSKPVQIATMLQNDTKIKEVVQKEEMCYNISGIP